MLAKTVVKKFREWCQSSWYLMCRLPQPVHTKKGICYGARFVRSAISLTEIHMLSTVRPALNSVPMTSEDVPGDIQDSDGILTRLSPAHSKTTYSFDLECHFFWYQDLSDCYPRHTYSTVVRWQYFTHCCAALNFMVPWAYISAG